MSQLLQLVVLARLLSPAEFGLIGILLVVVGFAQAYTDLGITSALIARRHETAEVRSSLYWLNLMSGAVVCALAVAAVPLVESVFNEPDLGPYARAIAAVFFIVAAGKQFEVLLQRELAFRPLGVLEALGAVLGTVAAIACAAVGLGVWAFVVGVLVTQGVKSVGLLVIGFRRFPPSFRFRWAEVVPYLSFGAYQMGERTLNFFISRVDQLLIGSRLGTTTLGLYNFAWNLTSQPTSRINPIVTRVAFPALAATEGDETRLKRGYLDMLRVLTAVNAPLLLGLCATAPAVVPAVFGDQWQEAVVLVQWLSVGALARTIINPVGSLMLARNRADMGFKWNVLILSLLVPTVLVGIEIGDAEGVAIGLALLLTGLLVLAYPLLIRPLIPVSWREYRQAIVVPMWPAVVMALGVAAIPHAVPGLGDAAMASLQVALGGAFYTASVWMFQRELVTKIGRLARPRATA